MVMDYCKGRSRDGPEAFLRGYAGALQTDGYAAYDAFELQRSITAYGCMAHARRKFYEAQGSEPDKAGYVLGQIKLLYDIERLLREEAGKSCSAAPGAPGAGPARTRGAEALAHPGLPRSVWGKAVRYMLTRWEKLTRFLSDGRIEVDNNLVENVIRPLAVGRKNYLFAGSHAAAERAAVVYSLLGTCKLHGVNPQA